jgi:uncharacterized protein YciI
MALTAKQVHDLHDKMLHKRLYVIFSEPTDKAGDRRKIFPKHIAYQLEIERKGILFAAGPFVDGKGKPQGPGMIVIRAKSMAEAKRVAEADPFHKLGSVHSVYKPGKSMKVGSTSTSSFPLAPTRLNRSKHHG